MTREIIVPQVFHRSNITGRDGYQIRATDLTIGIIQLMKIDNYFYRRAKRMNNDIQQATDDTEKQLLLLHNVIDKLCDEEKKVQDNTKKVASGIKQSIDKLKVSLDKINKTVDFNKLDHYAATLERIETSFSALAKLEEAGKLSKIMDALK